MSKALHITEPGKIIFIDDRSTIVQFFNSFGHEMITPSKMKDYPSFE